jgi:hypothetical protein
MTPADELTYVLSLHRAAVASVWYHRAVGGTPGQAYAVLLAIAAGDE